MHDEVDLTDDQPHVPEVDRWPSPSSTLRTWLAATLPERDDDRGASLVEYALLLALILVVCVIAVSVLGDAASESYSSTADGFG